MNALPLEASDELQLLNCHKGMEGVELETAQLCPKALPASAGAWLTKTALQCASLTSTRQIQKGNQNQRALQAI